MGHWLRNISQQQRLRPRCVIDATGDAYVAAWVGCPYEVAEPLQPMSLHFRIGFVELTFELRRKCAAVLEKAWGRRLARPRP